MVFNAIFNNMSWRSVLLVRKLEGRQVTPLRHIIHNPSQPVFAFTPVNTQHVVKITGVTSGAGIKNPYGAYECIHGFNRDCAVPFVVSCVVLCRSLFGDTCYLNPIDDDSTVLSCSDRGLMLWCLTPHSTIYRDAVPFVVSCVVLCRSLFVLFLKTYSEDKLKSPF
jgi:hypothetical protein